jgi:hypothetical protein
MRYHLKFGIHDSNDHRYISCAFLSWTMFLFYAICLIHAILIPSSHQKILLPWPWMTFAINQTTYLFTFILLFTSPKCPVLNLNASIHFSKYAFFWEESKNKHWMNSFLNLHLTHWNKTSRI